MSGSQSIGKLHVNIFSDLCVAYGLRKVVISPGSRNAPLIMAFHNQQEIECFVVPDERSAAYFAIGIAQYINQPVALVCTSGTAALNYAPAMAEAYYQQIPLVAITADRPPEWVDQSDGQTINQTGIYRNFTIYEAQLPVEAYSDAEIWHIERLVRDGFRLLTQKNRPVHFNVPIREPLYAASEQKKVLIKPTVYDELNKAVNIDLSVFGELHRYSRVLMVIGMKRPNPVFSLLIGQLALKKNIVILTETLSNLETEQVFQTSDALFSSIHGGIHDSLKPEVVISFGDMILSKPLKQWIRSLKDTDHWVVSQSEGIPDVFLGIGRIIHQEPENFLNKLINLESNKTEFFDAWKKAYERISEFHSEYIRSVPWSDLQAFRILSEALPDHSVVHLGNSSPVRYAQFFRWKKDIQFYSNRGTAGIDGVTSTAIGMASQTDKLVTLITGDISFLYDSNAFWNNYKKENFKIIVINNKGGNIFSLIGGPEDTGLLDKYFVTHVPVAMNYLCKAYGISYYVACQEEDLYSSLTRLYADSGCALLEIQTDPVINTRVWKEYFRIIKNKFQYGLKTMETDQNI